MNRRVSTPKFVVLQLCTLLLFAATVFAQETTAGLQGTIKDPSGALVANAQVVVTGTTLAGNKQTKTDGSGYYRFANLPPGTYNVTVNAEGFATTKREGLVLEVGRLPSIDFALQVGKTSTVVEVSGAAPLVNTTANTIQTNITADMINNAPHDTSFQSMIQFAPMARNEPLAGGQMVGGGTGGGLPGSSGNGGAVGYSIGGAADSESAYLVEGQDTENISGGYSNANVPFEFIQEVQVKTSGIQAEHGGALGGVVNVVMQKGSNAWHGSLFTTYNSDVLTGTAPGVSSNGQSGLRYDPTFTATAANPEPDAQQYDPKKDSFHMVQPGFTVGGPVLRNRLWFFLGFAPEYDSVFRKVNFAPATLPGNSALGLQDFTRDQQTYFTTLRLDATLTQKIRLFGSWLNQYQRASGVSLPAKDPIAQ